MGVATETGTWVGRPLLRFEDEALLRGEGRFIDDLDPVPHACHAAILRSPLAHARIGASTPRRRSSCPASSASSRAPTWPRCRTRSRSASTRRPTAPPPTRSRYAGEPLAVVVARDRYVAEDAAELVEVEYEPLEPVLDPGRGGEACVHDRSFSYGDADAAFERADLVVRETFRFPRLTCTPVECYGVVADWDAAGGR